MMQKQVWYLQKKFNIELVRLEYYDRSFIEDTFVEKPWVQFVEILRSWLSLSVEIPETATL